MNPLKNHSAEIYAVIGMNYQSAPIELREKIAFADSILEMALIKAKHSLDLAEIAIISTCNRTEIYIADNCAKEKINNVVNWIINFHAIDASINLKQYLYFFVGDKAIRQIMKVASGVDSMVFGESQILAQIKKAYNTAIKAGTQGSYLHHLFQKSFAIAKTVRSQTAIGKHPVSVAYVVNKLAEKIFNDITSCSCLLVGAGNTIQLIARYFHQNKLKTITIANRTLSNAVKLANSIGATAAKLEQVPELLKECDILVTSTANQDIIITKEIILTAINHRKHRPIFIVDIAVPRDVDPTAVEISDVFLYTVDDLHNLLESNMKLRKQATKAALMIIDDGVNDINDRLKSLSAVNILQNYRRNTTEICQQELKLANQKLSDGIEPNIVLQSFSKTLINKLMHYPSIEIKKAALENDQDKLKWAKNLLGLDS